MSWVLKDNGIELLRAQTWSPKAFGKHTGVSFPVEVPQNWTWTNDSFSLAWEDDPEPVPPTAEELLAQERERMVCSSAQGEIALRQAGLLDKVLAIVSADPVLDIAWRRAGEWRRTSATMKTLISILGWTDEFVDDLFRTAMRIEL